MGVVKNIRIDKYPKQSTWVGEEANVCFNYDSSKHIGGIIIRDDVEEPGETIIKLDDGRYVLATECQYGLANNKVKKWGMLK